MFSLKFKKKGLLFSFLVLSVFIITACGGSGNGDIINKDYVVSEFEVLVLDGNQAPIESASVILGQKNLSTSSQGVVVFEDIISGSYTLQVQKADYNEYNTNIIVGEDHQNYTANLNEILLEPMVLIEAGTTSSNNGSVTVEEDFYLGRYHVTQGEYESLMSKYYEEPYGENRSNFADKPDAHNRPIETLMWIEAALYANALSEEEGFDKYYNIDLEEETLSRNTNANGYRLPTAIEHEYAARGGINGEATKYPGSDSLEEVAWFFNNSDLETQQVGLKKPNELGLYDMVGNVNDWLDDGRDFADPVLYRGEGFTQYKTVFDLDAMSTRELEINNTVNQNIGFRLARTP